MIKRFFFKSTKITSDICNDTTRALSVASSCSSPPTSKNDSATADLGTTSTSVSSSAPAINIIAKVPSVVVLIANG